MLYRYLVMVVSRVREPWSLEVFPRLPPPELNILLISGCLLYEIFKSFYTYSYSHHEFGSVIHTSSDSFTLKDI